MPAWNVKVPQVVSVVIPVFNGAECLSVCLEGVFRSDYSSYECIVVNDGSTDSSPSIAVEFSGRVRLVNLMGPPHGPAYARNRGVELARGSILFFVDADVALQRDALGRVAKLFADRPDVAAVFGSYDDQPADQGVISRYRNLLHHFVHQNGNPNASSFWAGCGAIRREVFVQLGGFDEDCFPRASIEDIELGYRLKASGLLIFLDKELRGKHLKSWTLSSLIRTDIASRAKPWARLILETRIMPNDLNLKWRERISFALVALSVLLLLIAPLQPRLILGAAAALLGVVVFNRDLYGFFYRRGGALFTAACIPLHLLYYLYSGLTCVWVGAGFCLRKIQTFHFASQPRHKVES